MIKENNKAEHQDYWSNHFAAWEASSLTRRAYCEQEKISYKSFVYHRKRANKIKNKQQQFIQVKPEAVSQNQNSAGLQILLPNGVRIGLCNEVNIDLFQAVLKIAGDI